MYLVCRLLLEKKKLRMSAVRPHPDRVARSCTCSVELVRVDKPGPYESLFCFIRPAPTAISTLSLHDALPICDSPSTCSRPMNSRLLPARRELPERCSPACRWSFSTREREIGRAHV